MLRQDSTKRYNQLAVDLLKKILNRHYLPGSKLPSTRELAKQAGVNPNTMQRALQVLQDEKILIKQSTTGRYVTTDIQHLKNIRKPFVRYRGNANRRVSILTLIPPLSKWFSE